MAIQNTQHRQITVPSRYAYNSSSFQMAKIRSYSCDTHTNTLTLAFRFASYSSSTWNTFASLSMNSNRNDAKGIYHIFCYSFMPCKFNHWHRSLPRQRRFFFCSLCCGTKLKLVRFSLFAQIEYKISKLKTCLHWILCIQNYCSFPVCWCEYTRKFFTMEIKSKWKRWFECVDEVFRMKKQLNTAQNMAKSK